MNSIKAIFAWLALMAATAAWAQSEPSLATTPVASGAGHTLQVVANPAKAGNVYSTAGETIPAGEEILVSAYANPQYTFDHWAQGEQVVSRESSFTYTMPANDVTLTAHFRFTPDSPLGPGQPQQQDAIYGATVEAKPGQQVYYTLSLNHSLTAANGFTVDITFPEGLVPDMTSVVMGQPGTGHRLGVTSLGSGGYRLVVNGTQPLPMINGKVLDIPVVVPQDAQPGKLHPVALANGKLLGSGGQQTPIGMRPGGIQVGPAAEPGLTALFDVWKTQSTVVFTNKSSAQARRYEWNFGDGTTSYKASPTHTYAKPGRYKVRLTAFGQADNLYSERYIDIDEVSTFAVRYYVDGKEHSTTQVAYGSPVTPIAAPTKEGHTFGGWQNVPATMPDHDVAVEGNFVVNSYIIKFMVDGKEQSKQTLQYGATITPPAAPTKEGHMFSGWSKIPATMPAKDVTISGSFAVNSYTVTFLVDGKEQSEQTVQYGTKITPPAAPTKEGHTFSGWSEIPASMPAGDVTISGSFTVNSYTVTFLVDGKEQSKQAVQYGTKITPPAAPTKEGHTFSGWSEIPTTMPAGDVTISGSFAVNSYTVTFLVDGKEQSKQTTQYGTKITPPAAPTKEGHTFSGWSEIPATMPAKDVTISGSFAVNSYTVTFLVDGKEQSKQAVQYGTKITPPAAPTKEGHTFSGWSEIPASMPAGDVTISGSFTVNSYTVTFLVDGKEQSKQTVQYGTKITPPEAPTKEGHTFSGWSEIPATMSAGDINVSGTFAVNSYNIQFLVDGKVVCTQTIPYGSKIAPPEAPAKEGHTFIGWKNVPATMPAKDVQVSASYAVNTYTVTYEVDGKEYTSQSVAYGSAVTPPVDPKREGHTFSGWQNVPATMPARNVMVHGAWVVNKYAVRFVVDGKEIATMYVTYGTAIAPPEAPAKEGHTWSGWGEIPATMPARALEIRGSYTVNSYTVVYLVEGKEYQRATVKYGAPIVLPTAPTQEGHTWGGWSEAPATMPACDVEISGEFRVNSYTLIYIIDGVKQGSASVPFGSAITPPEAPAKEGHTWKGWQGVPETMPARDVEVTGSYAVNSYVVTYMVEGAVLATLSIPYGQSLLPLEAPTRLGYTFGGWNGMPATMPARDVTVEGSFSINSYVLRYFVDGVEYVTTTLEFGTAITPIECPAREGLTFSGWSEIPASMPARDVDVSGWFAVNYYAVVYYLDGQKYSTDSIACGAPLTLPTPPVRDGYEFGGWQNVPDKMPAKDLRVDGVYNPKRYQVTYIVEGDTLATDSVAYLSPLTPPTMPTREGYSWGGWQGAPEAMPMRDVVIRGEYMVNCYTITYYVDGQAVEWVSAEYGSAIVPIAAPVREGYTFDGWRNVPETMPAGNISIEGSFTINYYTITYLVDGKEYHSERTKYGSVLSPISAPKREGHTFGGWEGVPSTMPARDIAINGTFTVNTYTIIYYVDGEEWATDSVAYGAEVKPFEVPEKEGYTFGGWSEIPATMPAEDVVVTGMFTAIEDGIGELRMDADGTLTVYSLTGRIVRKACGYNEAVKGLPRGVYIIGGRKVKL